MNKNGVCSKVEAEANPLPPKIEEKASALCLINYDLLGLSSEYVVI